MPNIVFLIDTSGSMNQRSIYGTTFLDIAKGAIENFMKVRQKAAGFSGDRFMLLTTDEFPKNIKVMWKDSQFLINELKSLKAAGVTLLGDAFKTAFDLLNINRMISRIDNYGMGRNPWFLEPTLILCITDGSTFTSNKGPELELTLPLSTLRGSELTTEPYRWDQRVFSLVLQIPGIDDNVDNFNQPGVPVSDNRALNDICEVTGGRSYKITSMKVLSQCLESISQKLLHGVVLKFISNGNKTAIAGFKKIGSKDLNGYSNGIDSEKGSYQFGQCQKMILVKNQSKGSSNGQWPIPEPYFTDRNMHELSPRTAHPEVTVVTHDVEALECDFVTPDVYEIEACPMTHYILERKQSAAWAVFISKSGLGEGLGHSFGYIKAHEGRKVNLHVYPYNYLQLFPLLNELVRVHKVKPPTEWCKRFDAYINSMPLYYALPMRESLKKIGAGHLVPESLDYYQSHNISNYLKTLAQLSKQENERIVALIGRQERISQSGGVNVVSNSAVQNGQSNKQANFHQLIASLSEESDVFSAQNKNNSNPSIQSSDASSEDYAHLFAGFTVPNIDPKFKPDRFRNPFDTNRAVLVDQVGKMRTNFHCLAFWGRPFFDMVDKHNIAISAMGNYQDFIGSRVAPLRELDPTPPRQHAFGNPYKLAGADRDKMMIDETEDFDEHQVSASMSNQNGSSLSSNGKRPAPLSSPVMYKPGKRIKPPNVPPAVYENASLKDPSKLKQKLKERKNGKVKTENNDVTKSHRLTNGGSSFRTTESGVESFEDEEEYEQTEQVEKFDHTEWKRRTDELVHSICRIIRYPTPHADATLDSLCNKLDGPCNYKLSVIKFLVAESERFKRFSLREKLKLRLGQLRSQSSASDLPLA